MTTDFYAFLREAEQRKCDLGMIETDGDVEALRNKGSARTTAKRELLAKAQARASKAGSTMPPSYF